jgi:hypothetical protein
MTTLVSPIYSAYFLRVPAETSWSDRKEAPVTKRYVLIGDDGKPYSSECKGALGGYRRLKIYGRLDCASALRHIARGGYVNYRVFFASERTAISAGYRPCAKCLPAEYASWKAKSTA